MREWIFMLVDLYGIYSWLDGTHFSWLMRLSWNLHSPPNGARQMISLKALMFPSDIGPDLVLVPQTDMGPDLALSPKLLNI